MLESIERAPKRPDAHSLFIDGCRRWMQGIVGTLKDQIRSAKLQSFGVRLAHELAEAMDPGNPMMHVHPSNPTEFLLKQAPTLLTWVIGWRERQGGIQKKIKEFSKS